MQTEAGLEKLPTVEVRNASRQICQAHGKLNRIPTERERNLLHRWATAAGLRLASYV